MQYTENYQFRKPVIGVDDADVKDINFNSDRADTLIHNTQISLAPAYDLNETYNTGDVVMYETLMYKCKEDNVTGAWVPEKWERTTAGEEGSGGGGGSSVVPNPQGEPTDTLNTIGIDGTIFDIAGSGGGGAGDGSEIIPISAGDGTTSRTFTLERTPKKVTLQGYTSGDGGWYESGYFIWGENFMNLIGAQYTIATGGYAGQAAISYGADGKSFTITAANAFGAFNRADSFSGMMLVDYGGGSSGEGYSETSLYTYTGSTRQTTLSLSDDYTNYDAIEFTFGWNLGGDDFETVDVISSSKIVSNVFVNVGGEGRYNYISRGGADDEIILATATGSWDGSSIIREVRGINY